MVFCIKIKFCFLIVLVILLVIIFVVFFCCKDEEVDEGLKFVGKKFDIFKYYCVVWVLKLLYKEIILFKINGEEICYV